MELLNIIEFITWLVVGFGVASCILFGYRDYLECIEVETLNTNNNTEKE